MNSQTHEVLLTDGARADLARIHSYIADHASLDDADRILDRIMARLHALAKYPERGSIPKELEEVSTITHRQLVSGNYRLFYRVVAGVVQVALVADGRRDMRRLLQTRLLRS